MAHTSASVHGAGGVEEGGRLDRGESPQPEDEQ